MSAAVFKRLRLVVRLLAVISYAALLAMLLWLAVGFFRFAGEVDQTILWEAFSNTMQIACLALLLSLPIGMSAGACFSEADFSRPLRSFFAKFFDGMADLPTVLYGVLGVLLCRFAYNSRFNAAFALTLVLLPRIVGATMHTLRRVPASVRQASMALGASKTDTLFSAVVPLVWPGLAGIALYSLGFVFAESTILTMLFNHAEGGEEALRTLGVLLLQSAASQPMSFVAAGILLLMTVVLSLLANRLASVSGRRTV